VRPALRAVCPGPLLVTDLAAVGLCWACSCDSNYRPCHTWYPAALHNCAKALHHMSAALIPSASRLFSTGGVLTCLVVCWPCRIGGRPVNATWAEPKRTEADTSQVGTSAALPALTCLVRCMCQSCCDAGVLPAQTGQLQS
jgi:hypothetical protein